MHRCAPALVLVVPAACAAQNFEPLGDITGGLLSSRALAVSADGVVVVGASEGITGEQPFRWTHAGGMTALSLLPGCFTGRANGVSGDGTLIAGRCGDRSTRWVALAAADLNTFNDGSFSSANAVSRDGLAIVGNAFNGDFSLADTWPYRWTSAGCFHLGAGAITAGNFEAYGALAASADAAVIVGNEGYPIYDAFRWTSASGLVNLGFLPFGPQTPSSSATACSSDGSVLAGWSVSIPGRQAFRWMSGGMVGLGDLPGGGFSSEAMGVNGNGTVIVGRGTSDAGDEAFIWTAADGMRPLAAVIAGMGITEANGWTLRAATAITPDGRTIVGYGTNPDGNTEGWILRLPAVVLCYVNCDASTSAPVLNTLDFACFLDRFSAGDSYANCDQSTVAPVLNVLDFMCFLNRFTAGCS